MRTRLLWPLAAVIEALQLPGPDAAPAAQCRRERGTVQQCRAPDPRSRARKMKAASLATRRFA